MQKVKMIPDKIKNIMFRLTSLVKTLTLFSEFIIVSMEQLLKSLPENPKKILFTLNDRKLYGGDVGNNRYIYLIMNRFIEAGYSVYFYKSMDFKVYQSLGKYGRFIFKIKNLKILNKLPVDTSDMIYAFDSVDNGLLDRKWEGLVFVNTFMPPYCRIGDVVWIPYFMHAINCRTGQDKLVNLYRSNSRRIKMIFAGNTNKNIYHDQQPKNFYGQLTRLEGINALLELGDKVECGESRKKYEEITNTKDYINECRILLTDDVFPIKHDEWFNLLSASDFFVCLSGAGLPMCHNAIEAMAVGTIPIISYPDWFFPPLEHEKNAILYSGKDDLIKKLHEVLNMPIQQIAEIRKNVIEYYERYLSNESFIREFESQNERIFTIMLHPRLVCKKDQEERGGKLYKDLQSKLGDHNKISMEKSGIKKFKTLQSGEFFEKFKEMK